MVEFVSLTHAGQPVSIECQWLNREREHAPLLVFLHEGLGSVSMWRDYPQTLCDAAGCRGLVYSRPGYGRSTPREPEARWQPDYLHIQSWQVLPALLDALGVEAPCWLFGHSDGGSMALLFAARFAERTAGIITLAPHIFVEEITVAGIAAAREAYLAGGLRQGLARHHADPDSPFWGWNHAWLNPAFRQWNLEADIVGIRCPVLAIQGEGDEYASMAQIDGIQRIVPHTRLLKLADCGHSPHRDQAAAVTEATLAFLRSVGFAQL
jgi:pimeloyl-ACP methyl ester carboxylesterase